MYRYLRSVIKQVLPQSLVAVIQEKRKKNRQAERYSLNKGEDIVSSITASGVSFSIYINPFLNGGVDDDIYKTGVWEPEITTEIFKYLPVGGTFVDIGANIGYHSLCAAAHIGATGKVFSFEPLPRLQAQFQRSITANAFETIEIKPVALAEKAGTATLSLVDENVGASSLMDVATDRAVGSSVRVEVRTLDSYIADIQHIDVIKIDIEGSEFEALKGGEQLLTIHKPVIILEFSPQVYEKDYQGKSLDLYMYIKNLGYTISVIGYPYNIEEMLRAGALQELHQNFLCVPLEQK